MAPDLGKHGEPLKLYLLPGTLCIVRLPADGAFPDWAARGRWWSVTRTRDELSVVCEPHLVPAGQRQTPLWRALQVEGPLDFELTGILHQVTDPMARAGISLFAVSTYDTDYVLVREQDLDASISCLEESGIIVRVSE